MKGLAGRPLRPGSGQASTGSGRTVISGSLVLVVDFPHRFLHEALDHGVERYATLLRLVDAERARGRRADLHLLFGVAGGDLLGRLCVDDLVAHADDPDAGGFVRVHRTDGRAAYRGAAPAAERPEHASHLSEGAAVEPLLSRGDLLGL